MLFADLHQRVKAVMAVIRTFATKAASPDTTTLLTLLAWGMMASMGRPKPRLSDYGVHIFGALFTSAFLAFARERGWSWPLSIILLIAVSVPIGLALAWVRQRLKSWRRKVR
ncbi:MULTISPECIES: hypothetical protein [Sphingobium]|uniref:hypothetical protein n=1 Tax=Sphingobium TaxID=165695 RepID=UPI00183E8FC2|nr:MULTISPECIES: hypothetical protein [Sphingobium]MCW2400887.1 hypothetical protein [Sphingobium sp. B10D7B]